MRLVYGKIRRESTTRLYLPKQSVPQTYNKELSVQLDDSAFRQYSVEQHMFYRYSIHLAATSSSQKRSSLIIHYSADPSVAASGLISSTFNSLLQRGHLTCSGSSIGSSSLLSDGHLLSKCAFCTSACTSVSSFLHTNSRYWANSVLTSVRI